MDRETKGEGEGGGLLGMTLEACDTGAGVVVRCVLSAREEEEKGEGAKNEVGRILPRTCHSSLLAALPRYARPFFLGMHGHFFKVVFVG